jgi:hypothetical protein
MPVDRVKAKYNQPYFRERATNKKVSRHQVQSGGESNPSRWPNLPSQALCKKAVDRFGITSRGHEAEAKKPG